MADIDLKRAHALGLPGARAAAEKMADQLGRKFGLQGKWAGNNLSFERPGVSGLLAVSEKDIHLSVTLGFLLKAMKGSIERAVNEELDQLFAKAKAAKPAKAESKAKPEATKKATARPKKSA